MISFKKGYPLLFLSFLTGLFLFYLSSNIRFDSSVWLPNDNPHKKNKDYLYTEFERGEELLLVLNLGEDFFQDRFISIVSNITKELEEEEGVVEVKNPLTATTIIQQNEIMEILSFEKALTKKILPNLIAYKNRFTKSNYFGRLISKDYKRVGFLIKIEAPLLEYNYQRRQNILRASHRIVDKYIGALLDKKDSRFQRRFKRDIAQDIGKKHFTGAVRLNYALAKYTEQDLFLFIPMVIALIFILLYCVFQRLPEVIMITYVALLLLGLCFGVFVVYGYPMTAISISLPVLILVITIADAIHVFSRWYDISSNKEMSLPDAVKITIKETWLPCLITSITTGIGFGSFYFSELIPLRHFGEIAFIVVLIAYVLIMLHLWLFLSLFGIRLQKQEGGLHPLLGRVLVALYDSFIFPARYVIFTIVLIMMGVAFYSFRHVRTETNFLDVFFKKTSAIYQDFDYVDKYLGGTGDIDIILRSPDENESIFKEIASLKFLESLESKILEHELTNYTRSYLTPLRMVHKEFINVSHEKNVLPSNENQLAQEILFLEFSRGDEKNDVLSPYIDFDYTNSRVQIQAPNLNSANAKKIKDYLEKILLTAALEVKQKHFSKEQIKSSVAISGSSIYFQTLSEYVIETQLVSMSLTVGIIWLLFWIQFRFKLATIGVIANILPILLTSSIIIYLDIPFDFATVLISSVSFGLCVDDTIHFLHFYHLQKKVTNDSDMQIKNIIRMIGQPILFTSVLFSCAFFVFTFSNLVILIKFGIFTLVSLFFAFISNVIVLPTFLRILDKGKSQNPKISKFSKTSIFSRFSMRRLFQNIKNRKLTF